MKTHKDRYKIWNIRGHKMITLDDFQKLLNAIALEEKNPKCRTRLFQLASRIRSI